MNKWTDVPTGKIIRPFNVGRQATIGYMIRSDRNALYLTMPVEYYDMVWDTATKHLAHSVTTRKQGDRVVAKIEWF